MFLSCLCLAATTQTVEEGDFSSPLATLRTNKSALARGDAELLKRCYYTTDANEQAALDTILQAWALRSRFQQGCIKRWGEEAGRRVSPGFNLAVPPEAREEITGETATLHNIGGARPTELRRIEGQWRMTYGSLVANNFRDLPKLLPQQLKAVFQLQVDLYQDLCDRVSVGKFATIDDAAAAQQRGQRDAMERMREIIGAGK